MFPRKKKDGWIMFYSELMEKLDGCHNLERNSTLAIRKPREHGAYLLLSLGRLWPTTKRQAEYMVKCGKGAFNV